MSTTLGVDTPTCHNSHKYLLYSYIDYLAYLPQLADWLHQDFLIFLSTYSIHTRHLTKRPIGVNGWRMATGEDHAHPGIKIYVKDMSSTKQKRLNWKDDTD
jgi:hypothetical protein